MLIDRGSQLLLVMMWHLTCHFVTRSQAGSASERRLTDTAPRLGGVRIARYRFEQDVSYGIVDGEVVREIAGTPFPGVSAIEVTGTELHIDDVDLLAPVLPTKIIAVARNYTDHAREMGGEVSAEPIIFLKPSTAVIGPEAAIVLPAQSRQVEHEAELAVVIGRVCKDVARATGAGGHPRLHVRERRHRPRPAAPRTGSGAVPRASTPAARSAPGSRPTSTPTTWRSSCA